MINMQKEEKRKTVVGSTGMAAPKTDKLADEEDKFLDDAVNVFPAARVLHKANKKYKLNQVKAPVKQLSER